MSQADEYRVRAAEFRAKARHEGDASVRIDLESLARAYVRLAEQAEKNQQLDVTYEPPPPKIGEQDRSC